VNVAPPSTLPDDAAEDSFDQLPVWRGERASVRDFLVHNTSAKKWGVRRGDWLLLAQPDGYHNRTLRPGTTNYRSQRRCGEVDVDQVAIAC
jgi:hypothetical protein